MNNNALVSILLWIFTFFAFHLPNSYSIPISPKIKPKVVNGSIDFTNWDFKENGSIELSGDWKFYWKKFIDPKSLISGNVPKEDGFLKIPSTWSGFIDTETKKEIGPFGYGTYILELKGLKDKGPLGFNSLNVFSSYKMFVVQSNNVTPLFEVGVISKEKKTATPLFNDLFSHFPNVPDRTFLVIHGTNFHYRNGGTTSSPEIGDFKKLKWKSQFIHYRDLFTIGILFIIGLYHLGLYYQRRKDKGSLFFGLFCLTIFLRLVANGYYLSWFFERPSVFSFNLTARLDYFSLSMLTPFIVGFMNDLFGGGFKTFKKVIFCYALLFLPLILFLPPYYFSQAPVLYGILGSVVVGATYGFLKLCFFAYKGVPFSRQVVFGSSFLVLGVIHDIMVTPLAILNPPQILPFTFVIFIFVQSYILSIKFSKAYETADRLSKDLQKEVNIQTKEAVDAKNRAEESEKEVADLIHNMKQSVFTIDASGSVFPPVSEYSKELFGENVEGKHVYDTLFKSMDKKGEDFSYIDTSLSVIFDSDDLQWNLVRDYFPHKINYRFNKESDFKILRISYTPLWDQKDLLEKLMFVIEDITELENLETKMKNQEEEAAKRALIIQELAASKKEEIHQFFNSILVLSNETISFWKRLREGVKAGETHFELETLFRNLHTVKGNARIFGMTLISKSAHDVETNVESFKNFEFKKDELESINRFLENLYDLQAQINEYLDQARDLFGFELEEDKNSKIELHELLKEFDYWFGQFRFMDISMLSLEVGSFVEKIEKLDTDFKDQVFSSLKRIMHSLKGLSRSMNEKEFSKYVHLLEGGIDDIEKGILVDQEILEEKLFFPLNEMRSFGRKIFFQSSLFKPLKKTHEIWCSIFKDFFKMCSLWKDINEDNEEELKRALYTINAKTSGHQLYYFPCIIRSTYDYFEDGWANHKDQITFNFQQMALFFKLIFQLDIEKNIFGPIRDSLIVHLKKHRIEQMGDWDKLLKEIYRISQISQDPLLIMVYNNLAKEGVSYYEFKDMLCFLFDENDDNIFEVLIPINDATPFLNNIFLNLKVDYSVQSFDFVEGLQDKNYETSNTLKSLLNPTEVTWYSYLESIDVMRILNNYIDYEDETIQEGMKPPVIEVLSENLLTLQEQMEKGQKGNGVLTRDQMKDILNYLIEAPVKYSLKNLKAMVEDIASGLGKKIKFKLTGIEGSLGQKELNLLKDATVHLVRNSVDHGIEMPEDRLNGGKEEIGNLEINFSLDPASNLNIRIQDDGAGLDPEVICRKAIEKGILEENKAQNLNEQDKIDLIFLPGFSTKSSINELSGRGVGMDVVKTNLEKMGANLKIESRKGEGTAFILTLPKSFEVEKI